MKKSTLEKREKKEKDILEAQRNRYDLDARWRGLTNFEKKKVLEIFENYQIT